MASMTESAPQTTMQVPITEVDHLTAWKIRLMRIEDDVFNQADERNDDSWKGYVANKLLAKALRDYIAFNHIHDYGQARDIVHNEITPGAGGYSVHLTFTGAYGKHSEDLIVWMLCYPHIAFQYLDSPPMAAPTSQEQVEAAVEKPAAAVLENPEAVVGSSPVIDLTSEPTPIDRILELERQGFVGDLEATRQANELMKEVLKPWYSDEPQTNEDAPFDPDTITLDPPEFYNAPLASANPVAATHESRTVTPENVQEPSSATSESVQTAVTTPVKQAATPEHVRTMDNMFPKDVQPTAARKASPSPAGQTPHVAVGPSTPDVPQHGRYPPSGGLAIPLNDQHSSPLAVAQSPLALVARPYGPQPHNPYHPGQLITPPDSQSSSAASANPSKKRKVGPSSSEGSPKRTKRQNPGLNVDGAKRRPGRPPKYVIDPVDSRRIDAETEALYKEGNGYAPKRKPGSKAKVAGGNVANNVSQQGSSTQAAQTMAPTSQQQANAGDLRLVGVAEQQRVGAPEGHMVPRLPPNNHSVPVGGYHHVGNVPTQHSINNPQGQMGPRQPPGGPFTQAGAQYRPRFHPYQPPLGPPQGQMGPAQSPSHPSMMNGYQPRAVTPSGQPIMNASQQQMRSAQSAGVSFRPAGRHYQPGMHPGQQYLSAPQPRGYSPGSSTAASTPSGHMQPSPITTQHMGQSMPQQPKGYAQPPGNFNPNFQPAHQMYQGALQPQNIFALGPTNIGPTNNYITPLVQGMGNGMDMGMQQNMPQQHGYFGLGYQPPPALYPAQMQPQESMPHQNGYSGPGYQQPAHPAAYARQMMHPQRAGMGRPQQHGTPPPAYQEVDGNQTVVPASTNPVVEQSEETQPQQLDSAPEANSEVIDCSQFIHLDNLS